MRLTKKYLAIIPLTILLSLVPVVASAAGGSGVPTTTAAPTAHVVRHHHPRVRPLVLRTHYRFGEVSNRVVRLQRFMHFTPQDGLYGYEVRHREIQSLINYKMSGKWLPQVPGWYYSWRDATHPCEEPVWNTVAGGLGWLGGSWSSAKSLAHLTLAPTSPSAATPDEQIVGGQALNGSPPWTTVGSCLGYTGW